MDDQLNASEPGVAPQPVAVPEPAPKPAGLFNALSWIRDLAFSVLIAVILIVFIYQPVKVEGTSMMPALTDQERIFINKFNYHFGIGSIERGDMVVFWFPARQDQVVHQARDRTARRHGGDRSRPGDRQRQVAGRRATCRKNIATAPPTLRGCPAGQLLRAGRPPQFLQRQPQLGLRGARFIYGKAVFVYWPLDKMGRLQLAHRRNSDTISGRITLSRMHVTIGK